MGRDARETLLAVLANPPTSGGARTLSRVEQAALVLGYGDFEVANLFSVPSKATGEIERLGVNGAAWLAARADIELRLSTADAVLLAYGIRPPMGPAGAHFHAQVDWLNNRLTEVQLPAWWVGDGPRHPSRWQRWTHRAHPDLSFPDALERGLVSAVLKPQGPPARLEPRRGQELPRATELD